ncbi:MAG: 4'-phosphopantetheinyl transferase family protein [Panacagrimonas sp.]
MSLTVLSLDETIVSPSQETAWLADLPAARRAQLQAWPDANARRRSLLGSRLLREGLLRLGHPPDALGGLRYPDRAKPTLDLPLDFSIAHCAGRILCALSAEGPVGVDVEAIGVLTAAGFGLYFTAHEREWAGSDPQRFYTLWTRKEAVVKAAGTGGLRHLQAFEMIGDQARFAGTCWLTAPLVVGSGYIAHVACADVLPAPTIVRIAPETLL